ncbi:unnamed protein product, partial [Sphacelaria rigidula]
LDSFLLPLGKRPGGGSGGAGVGGGSRLVRWAASLAAGAGAGKAADAASGASSNGRPAQSHSRTYGGGGVSRGNPAVDSFSAGDSSGNNGSGCRAGDSDTAIGPTSAQGLFTTSSSSLRNRFRSSGARRGGKRR